MTEPLPPGAFAKALQSRRASERRRRWIIRGVLTGVAVMMLVGGWLAYFSPVFATRAVTVEGAALLTSEEVTAAAAVQTGVPLARQDVRAAAERVAALPAVREATVSRELPGAIKIRVTEREVAFQRQRGGQWEWVDADGVVFRATPQPQPDVLQVSTSSTDERLLRDVATVARYLPQEVRPDTVRLTAEAVDRITVTLAAGRTIVWGSAEESGLKSEVVSALLSVEAKTYDVSAPRHPTTS